MGNASSPATPNLSPFRLGRLGRHLFTVETLGSSPRRGALSEGGSMDAARKAVERYKKLSTKEKKWLKDNGISTSEVLFIMFLQISNP